MPKKEGVPAPVVRAVKAWAAERDLDRAPAVLAEQRRLLDPALLPALLVEVAEIQGELLLEVLDLPPRRPPKKDQAPVEVLGLQLGPDQVERFKGWIDDQGPTAQALGLDLERWARHLEQGLAATIARLRGDPSSGTASPGAIQAAERLLSSTKLIGGSEARFEGGADPRTSERAGLRGVLLARSFDKKK